MFQCAVSSLIVHCSVIVLFHLSLCNVFCFIVLFHPDIPHCAISYLIVRCFIVLFHLSMRVVFHCSGMNEVSLYVNLYVRINVRLYVSVSII